MSDTFQTIIIIIIAGIALWFLVRKFIWKPKQKKTTKACGKEGCGCH